MRHPFLKICCQTLENVQGEVQTGNRQHSSCPSVQKSRRAESGLAWMRAYLRTGKGHSSPVYFFYDHTGGELPPVFQRIQKAT